MNITLMDGVTPIILKSKMTQERKFDRFDVQDDESEPLTYEESSRLMKLIEKVDSCGSTSCLTKEEAEEYEDLGRRHNSNISKQDTHNLGTAVRPWITQ